MVFLEIWVEWAVETFFENLIAIAFKLVDSLFYYWWSLLGDKGSFRNMELRIKISCIWWQIKVADSDGMPQTVEIHMGFHFGWWKIYSKS